VSHDRRNFVMTVDVISRFKYSGLRHFSDCVRMEQEARIL
jgi:hypothetical protein